MRKQSWIGATLVALGAWVGAVGCTEQVSELLAPGFFDLIGAGRTAANLPGDAPAVLVAVENRTSRWSQLVISYRDADQAVQTYTASVPPQGRTAQLLSCPIGEITIGDVSNLTTAGARIYLVDSAYFAGGGTFDAAPYIDVEAFGVLLRDETNYNCGDELIFTVQASSATRSGYQLFAYVRRSGA
ncbi:MAG: hypothetical protein IPM18_14565 [Phycisphaerales bacterium]|nr:hypothetical protein [Phycisphaerales bacterium]